MRNQQNSRLKIQKNVKLAPYTTLDIGGPADYFTEVKTYEEIKKVLAWARNLKIPLYFLGGGSNLLIADKGVRGLVIKIKNQDLKIKHEQGKISVIAGAGITLPKLLSFCVNHSLSGLEFLVGIPGTLGGAIVGNAGVKDYWISQKIEKIKIIDRNGKIYELGPENCHFGYRTSLFRKKNDLIFEAVLNLKKSEKRMIKEKIEQFQKKRFCQPKGKSAGCIFKNPPQESAGYLIEKIGLKGKIFGNLKISQKHANFFINLGEAKAEEVVMLIKLIQKRVRDKFGIMLEPEIFFLGDFNGEIVY